MNAALRIEYRKTGSLIPYARNPRRNDQAVPKMAGIIQEFGFRVPVIIRSDGTVVDGHLRLKAAIALGMETVPCIVADDLTETQVKALRIAVNRAAELAEWDTDLLRLELQELKEEFDLLKTGFDVVELDDLLGDGARYFKEDASQDEDGDGICCFGLSFTAEQKALVSDAIKKAKGMYSFNGTGNESVAGNALAAICEAFNGNS